MKIIWKKTGTSRTHAPVQYDTENRFMIWTGKSQKWGLYEMKFKEGVPSECKLLFESQYMKDIKAYANKIVSQNI